MFLNELIFYFFNKYLVFYILSFRHVLYMYYVYFIIIKGINIFYKTKFYIYICNINITIIIIVL